ncbi:MAG: type II toxin-antitoxin system HicA family toxin [Patescibacteria group bacterium]
MTLRLPRISGRDAVKAFSKIGYRAIRQRGSHIRLVHTDSKRIPLMIPDHAELSVGLLRRILRDADLSLDEFQQLL